VKLTVSPALSVVLPGGEDTVKGNAGAVKPVIVTGFADTFVNVTSWLTTGPPMGWRVKSAEGGDALSGLVAARPCPFSDATAVGPELLAVRVPVSAPRALGVKVTGTVMV
jgi:hypothetical protein